MKKLALVVATLSLFSHAAAYSAHKPGHTETAPDMAKMKELSSEKRHSLASIHEKMADCLKSNKPMQECHNEMMRSCQQTMGKEGCQMVTHHRVEENMKS